MKQKNALGEIPEETPILEKVQEQIRERVEEKIQEKVRAQISDVKPEVPEPAASANKTREKKEITTTEKAQNRKP